MRVVLPEPMSPTNRMFRLFMLMRVRNSRIMSWSISKSENMVGLNL